MEIMPCEFMLLESFNCEGTNLYVQSPLLTLFGADLELFRNGDDLKFVTASSIKSGNLKRLLIGSRIRDDNDTSLVADEYPASQTVEELSLEHDYSPELRIISIVRLYPNLQKLNVSYNYKITGVAVKNFVEMGIKQLKVNECYEISPDAVEYARGRGVQVEFNFPSRKTGKSYLDRVASS
jgi:F-box/TPR repeat protein Pof3